MVCFFVILRGDGIISPPFVIPSEDGIISLTIAPFFCHRERRWHHLPSFLNIPDHRTPFLSSRAQSPSSPPTIAPFLSSRAKSRDLLCAFLLPQISTRAPVSDTQRNHSFSRRAGESLLAAKRLLSRPTFLCLSDTGARVEICGRRKAQSRSLDCARDDKRGRAVAWAGGGLGERWLGRAVAWAAVAWVSGGLGERWLG